MTRQWKKISLADAKQHPLYGVRNWLAVFAFGVVVAPLRTLGELSNAAHVAGLTLPKLLAADLSAGAYFTGSLAFSVVLASIALWLLFSKHRHFRIATITLSILQWPAFLAMATITGGTKYPGFAAELVLNFLSSLLWIAIWVAYLQRSRRVRVTFEHCIVLEKSGADAQWSDLLARRVKSPAASDAAYAEALAEIEESRIDKGTWARSFAESGGDDSKAKSAYIKSRAASIHSAAEWSNTSPPNNAHAVRAASSISDASAPKAGNFQFTTTWLLGGVAVAGIVAAVALPAYQDYSKGRELAATPVQAPAPILDLSEFQKAPNSQTGPDWDKDVITAPENASAQDMYVQKVRAIQEKVKRGELAPVDGIASLEPPKNLGQWPNAESVKLEQSQTWWRNKSNQFNIHVQNTTPYQLTTLALDFGQQGCESSIAKRRFYVALRQVVTSGSQALLSFTPPISISDTPNNCLVVSSAWQPVSAIPAQAQPARLATTSNAESAKERADSKQVQADVDAVVKRAIEDYPFLDTQEGQPVLAKIVERRDEFIRKGVYPSIALTRAINDFAPAFVPKEMQVRKSPPVVESGDKGNHPGFDPKCRWVTPQDWSCK